MGLTLASPWWVNLSILVPVTLLYLWRKGVRINRQTLILTAIFAIAFGFIEGAVVIYLRAAAGLLPGFQESLSNVIAQSQNYVQSTLLQTLPQSLLTVEPLREGATIAILITLALIAAAKTPERWAIFLWSFSIWDLSYYFWLWALIRWPASLTTPDVLFLIPVPWIAQVWIPILISSLIAVTVIIADRFPKNN